MLVRKLFILFGVALLVSCSAKRDLSTELTDEQELEYYALFTEGTKHALTQNLKTAVEIYNNCIQKFPSKAAPYYQVSNIYLSVNDVQKAKAYAINAYKLDTANHWYLLHLANIYQYENNYDTVVMLYEDIVKLTNSPEYKYNLAVYYSSSGRYKESMQCLTELEKEFSNMREIILMRHRNYAALNEKDSAVVQLEHLIKLFPNEYENYGLLAEYLSEINRFEYAGKIYKDLLKIEPDNGLANVSYGDYYLKQGVKDSALVYYKNGFRSSDILLTDKIGIIFNYIYDPIAIKRDSVFIKELIEVLKETHNDSRVYTIAAEYYIKRDNFAKALEELETAIEIGAEAYIIWEQYIMISNYLKKFDKVEDVYNRAIEQFPNEIQLYINIAYSLYELREYEKSLDVTKKGVRINEVEKADKVQILNQMADAYRGLGQLEVGDSIYEVILDIDPDNLLVRNNYSYYLSLRGKNLERAEELSRLTVKIEPNNSTYLDTYGWILYMMGEYKDALKYLELAIKNGAYNSSVVLEHYGDAAYKLGRCNDAIEAWNESIKYNTDSNKEELLKEKISDANEGCN